MQEAAHNRRMELLAEIPLPDLQDVAIVDYGVGAWGFAVVFPALHGARMAIGIDISPTAVELSRQVSAEGRFPHGTNVHYFTARGGDLVLADDSVDVFFAGECIEHVELMEAFLDEVHRVWRTGGMFILTTPNADAALYRARGERYCVGIEHVALMGYRELLSYLTPGFDVVLSWGFNNSLLTELDTTIGAGEARTWAAMFRDQPELASGVVVVAAPRPGHHPRRYRHRYYFSDVPELIRVGKWRRGRAGWRSLGLGIVRSRVPDGSPLHGRGRDREPLVRRVERTRPGRRRRERPGGRSIRPRARSGPDRLPGPRPWAAPVADPTHWRPELWELRRPSDPLPDGDLHSDITRVMATLS